jgi:tetratricopeptide (TPR) repeat protein
VSRRLRFGVFAVAVIVGAAPAVRAQGKIKVAVDDKLLKCAGAYRAAVDQYRAGRDAAAADAIARLDRRELRTLAAVLLAAWETPANAAAPRKPAAADPIIKFLPYRWDTEMLRAAGMLHVDMALAASGAPRVDDFEFHTAIALVILAAADQPPGTDATGSTARRVALALGLTLLGRGGDRNIGLARQYLANAIKRFPDDAHLQLAYGTAIESLATLRDGFDAVGGVAPPGASVGIGRSRSGGMVRDDGNFLSRERSARVVLLREATTVFERVLAIDDTTVEARIRLAHIRIVERDDEHATALLEQALASEPAPEWTYIAELMLGDIRERAGRLQAAMEHYGLALAACPEGQSAYIALGHAMDAVGDSESAGRTIDRLFDQRLTPDADDPWWDYPIGNRRTAYQIFAELRAKVHR